ncbi:MAG TPA: glycerophosphodiester phosphodiesterase family protein, partial [Candidatus Deferrimicrobium sp.]|nr:glycerophosphodiester phosphodiesterase family protein [Candidatus Deferrimicrobium sp.]
MSDQRAPITFAHRGASGYLPENSLPAFRLALDQGATGLESDVWLSRDGEPILAHDRTIRLPGRRIDVTRRTVEELAPFGVPRLADLWLTLGIDFELSLD